MKPINPEGAVYDPREERLRLEPADARFAAWTNACKPDTINLIEVNRMKKGSAMIYIGKFLHTTNQQEKDEARRRHGEFNLLIAAADKQGALDKFKKRLEEIRKTTDFFEGEAFIYLLHLLEMEDLPGERARLFDYQSTAGDPVMPVISCQAPSGDTDGCRILDWTQNKPGVDGQAAIPFMKFKK